MPHETSLLGDVLKLGESLLGAVLDTRNDLKTDLRDKAEAFATKFDLVRREEMQAALKMLSKARLEQDSLQHRIDSLESKLSALTESKSPKKAKKAPAKKMKTPAKTLRSVKHGQSRKAR